jgi:hypothetical protein
MLIPFSDPGENGEKRLFPLRLKMLFPYQKGVKKDFWLFSFSGKKFKK